MIWRSESIWTSAILLIIVLLYIFLCIFPRDARKRRSQYFLLLGRGLEILIVFVSGGWKYLFSSANLNAGFLILSFLLGNWLYFQCLLITRLSFREALKYSLCIPILLKFYKHQPRTIWHYVISSFQEELVWRASIQHVLGNSLHSILITATLFTATHTKSRKPNILSLIELWLFAIFIGFLFWQWESLLLVTGIHTVRNVNLTFYFRMRNKLRSLQKGNSVS